MWETSEQQSGLPGLSANMQAMIGALIASPLAVYYYLRDESGRGLLCLMAGAVLVFIVSARWNLRKLAWFWVTIAIVVGVNLAIIVFVPWPSARGIRGPVLAPLGAVLGLLDYLAVWVAIKVVGRPSTKESARGEE